MKNAFFAGLLLILQGYAGAQVTLQPILPATGLIQKTQLWNIVLVNSSASHYSCRLAITLYDRGTNREVLSATSSEFLLDAGAKQLDLNSLNPVQYNYLTQGQESKLPGLIPAGNYTVCYLLTSEGDKVTNLAEECTPFDVEPLSPPLLILPADSSVLETFPVQYSWMPPSPDGIFDGLNYEILIAPINDGQKAEEAIQQNLPVFSQAGLVSNFLTYSLTYPSLEKDKWYAWQVIARDNNNYAGKTEVWVFKLSENHSAKTGEGIPYVKLESSSSKLAVAENGIIKIVVDNDAGQKKMEFQVYSLNGNKKRQFISFKAKLRPGENFLQYDLRKKFSLKEGETYQVKAVNFHGESLRGTFIVKNIK